MAYIGQSIKNGTFSVLDTSGNTYNGSNTTFSLGTQVGSAAQLLVSHDGVIQKPGTDYTLASGGTQITFTTAPASGASIFIVEISGAVGGTITPIDDSVTADKIVDDAVESEHLNNNIISGQTALGATPADTDEFLVSDAGTIKRVDYSYIKASNTPSFYVRLSGNFDLTNDTWTKIPWDTEQFDTDNAFASNKFTVPSGKGGKYFFLIHAFLGNQLGAYNLKLYKNGSALTPASQWAHINRSGSDADMSQGLWQIVDLSASDYIETYAQTTAGSNGDVIATTSFFQGFKLA